MMQHKVLACASALVCASVVLATPAATADRGAAGRAAAGRAAPARGVFSPGTSLAGVRIGMTKAEVLRAWATRHGVCRDCPRTTWYFNEQPFAPQGVGAVFEHGRVVRAFTVWRPQGWRTTRGLALGNEAGRITDVYGRLARHACAGYTAFDARGATGAESAFYVYRDKLWGFGLARHGESPCL